MKNVLNKPQLIEGGLAIDDRGHLIFANNFSFNHIKRFYMVENFSTDTIRAFHGHMKEAKYVFVVSGSAILAAVHLDNIKKPSKKNSRPSLVTPELHINTEGIKNTAINNAFFLFER